MMPVIQPTLLLITNHPQFIYLIKRYGERSGCQVISAGSVDVALELMVPERPALVLLHVMSWPHDGWSALRCLREHRETHNIPIAIISALMDEARARDEGAAYWLWQPVMYTDFLAALTATGVLPPSHFHPGAYQGS